MVLCFGHKWFSRCSRVTCIHLPELFLTCTSLLQGHLHTPACSFFCSANLCSRVTCSSQITFSLNQSHLVHKIMSDYNTKSKVQKVLCQIACKLKLSPCTLAHHPAVMPTHHSSHAAGFDQLQQCHTHQPVASTTTVTTWLSCLPPPTLAHHPAVMPMFKPLLKCYF